MADDLEPTEPPPPLGSLVPTPLIRRTSALPERAPLPPDIEEQFNQLARSVQVLSTHFLGESDSPPLETLKERGARRVKKFHRAGGDDPAAESSAENVIDPPADPEEVPDSLARNKHIAWPRQTLTEDASAPLAWWEFSPQTRWRVGALLLGTLLLGLGVLIGRSTASPTARNGATGRKTDGWFGQSELSEQAFLTANDALRAEHTGNADAARKLYETAVNRHVDLPGMNYRLALLALQRNDRLDAEQRLERSSTAGEEVAAGSYLLARIAADQSDFDEEATQFERATRARPFEGKYFFYYGEILRRQGKPQAAITTFEQALDRAYTAAAGDLYLFKERLAKVEYGRDDAFNAELAAHLKQATVGGDWLLLAAAQDLDRQLFAAAAEHLRQAENRLPATIYAELTHDYLFQTQAKRSELTGLLNRNVNPLVSSAGPTVLDPDSWLPERADPATWPSASGQPAR